MIKGIKNKRKEEKFDNTFNPFLKKIFGQTLNYSKKLHDINKEDHDEKHI